MSARYSSCALAAAAASGRSSSARASMRVCRNARLAALLERAQLEDADDADGQGDHTGRGDRHEDLDAQGQREQTGRDRTPHGAPRGR
jgi:hypothetical protein